MASPNKLHKSLPRGSLVTLVQGCALIHNVVLPTHRHLVLTQRTHAPPRGGGRLSPIGPLSVGAREEELNTMSYHSRRPILQPAGPLVDLDLGGPVLLGHLNEGVVGMTQMQ